MPLHRSILSTSLAFSLILPATSVFAKPVSPVTNYPDNTAAISISKIDIQTWLKAYQEAPAEAKEMIVEIKNSLAELKQETGIDLINDGLLNLDQHASFAFRPLAGQMGEGMFQFQIKSESRMLQLLKQSEKLLKKDSELRLVKEIFAGITLYRISLKDDDSKLFNLNLAVSKNIVLGSIGSDRGLKEMLYHQYVSPADSQFRLSNHADFQDAQTHLKQSTDSLYLRPPQFLPLLPEIFDSPEIKELLTEPWLQDLSHYYHGVGFGMGAKKNELNLKAFIQHKNLSKSQQNHQQTLVDMQKLKLNELMTRIPEDVILLQTGAQAGLEYMSNVPSEHAPPEGLKDLLQETSPEQWRQILSDFSGMDFAKEIDPAFDGRYALGVLKSNDVLPEIVMVLGLNPDQADFAKHLASKMKLNYEALLPEFIEKKNQAPNSALKANMYTFQTMLETHSVDWEGLYPASLSQLQKEAQEMGYWLDIKNPHQSGQTAIRPFSEFKADASQVGTLYYQGFVASKVEGQDLFKKYLIYGYGQDGKLYILSTDNESIPKHIKPLNPNEELLYVKENLPTQSPVSKSRVSPLQIESIQDTTIYSLPLPAEFNAEMKEILETEIQPVFAQQGSQLLFASTPSAMKKLLATQNAKHPQIQENMKKLNPGNHYFYLNMDSVLSQIQKVDDQELNELSEFIKPLHSIQAASQESSDHSQTQIKINLAPDNSMLHHLSGIPLIAGIFAVIAIPNFVGAQERAQTLSVKANMHTFHTLVETYAVDWGGFYPDSVATLRNEAQNSEYEYWKEISNPFTDENGEGKAYLDYRSYQSLPEQKGLVLYQISDDQTEYQIMGTDKDGQKILDKGQEFILSNS